MFQDIQDAIKKRAIFTFIIVHLGAACGGVALIRTLTLNGWDLDSTLFLIGFLLLYFGFLTGVFFIVAPILPWLKRAQQVDSWSERLLRELPKLLEQLPKIIVAEQTVATIWNESKRKEQTAGSTAEQKISTNLRPT